VNSPPPTVDFAQRLVLTGIRELNLLCTKKIAHHYSLCYSQDFSFQPHRCTTIHRTYTLYRRPPLPTRLAATGKNRTKTPSSPPKKLQFPDCPEETSWWQDGAEGNSTYIQITYYHRFSALHMQIAFSNAI